jgi:hypothetical protein
MERPVEDSHVGRREAGSLRISFKSGIPRLGKVG